MPKRGAMHGLSEPLLAPGAVKSVPELFAPLERTFVLMTERKLGRYFHGGFQEHRSVKWRWAFCYAAAPLLIAAGAAVWPHFLPCGVRFGPAETVVCAVLALVTASLVSSTTHSALVWRWCGFWLYLFLLAEFVTRDFSARRPAAAEAHAAAAPRHSNATHDHDDAGLQPPPPPQPQPSPAELRAWAAVALVAAEAATLLVWAAVHLALPRVAVRVLRWLPARLVWDLEPCTADDGRWGAGASSAAASPLRGAGGKAGGGKGGGGPLAPPSPLAFAYGPSLGVSRLPCAARAGLVHSCSYSGARHPTTGRPHGYGEWLDDSFHGECLWGQWDDGAPVGPFRSREFGSGHAFSSVRCAFFATHSDPFADSTFLVRRLPDGLVRLGVCAVECAVSGHYFRHFPAASPPLLTLDDAAGGLASSASASSSSASASPPSPSRLQRPPAWPREHERLALAEAARRGVARCLEQLRPGATGPDEPRSGTPSAFAPPPPRPPPPHLPPLPTTAAPPAEEPLEGVIYIPGFAEIEPRLKSRDKEPRPSSRCSTWARSWVRSYLGEVGLLTAGTLAPRYNTPLAYALERMGQLLAFARLPARIKPFIFSWPGGRALSYPAAHRAAAEEWMGADLLTLLAALRANGVRVVHVLAHSMGARVLCAALPQLLAARSELLGPGGLHLANIALLSPDVSTRDFLGTHLPLMRRLGALPTVYGDRHDRPLYYAQVCNHLYARPCNPRVTKVQTAGRYAPRRCWRARALSGCSRARRGWPSCAPRAATCSARRAARRTRSGPRTGAGWRATSPSPRSTWASTWWTRPVCRPGCPPATLTSPSTRACATRTSRSTSSWSTTSWSCSAPAAAPRSAPAGC